MIAGWTLRIPPHSSNKPSGDLLLDIALPAKHPFGYANNAMLRDLGCNLGIAATSQFVAKDGYKGANLLRARS